MFILWRWSVSVRIRSARTPPRGRLTTRHGLCWAFDDDDHDHDHDGGIPRAWRSRRRQRRPTATVLPLRTCAVGKQQRCGRRRHRFSFSYSLEIILLFLLIVVCRHRLPPAVNGCEQRLQQPAYTATCNHVIILYTNTDYRVQVAKQNTTDTYIYIY